MVEGDGIRVVGAPQTYAQVCRATKTECLDRSMRAIKIANWNLRRLARQLQVLAGTRGSQGTRKPEEQSHGSLEFSVSTS